MKKYIYSCDCGCLVLVVNGARLMVGNGYGDGCFSVTIGNDRCSEGFDFTGLSIEGPFNIDVLEYDCWPSAKTLESFSVEEGMALYVYRKNGDFYLRKLGHGKDCK